MKSLIAVACLAVSVGCASLGYAPSQESGPLRAYLLPHSGVNGSLSFHVSRPAHVAVFRIGRGGQSELVYPSAGGSSHATTSNYVFSGFHALGSNRRGSDFNYAGYQTSAAYGPEFYFMIASEEPLRLGQFGAFGSRLTSGMSFMFNGAQNAMEELVSLSVPNVADESWTTDYYVHWPEPQNSRRGSVQIICNGNTITVPFEQAEWAALNLCTRPETQPDTPTTPPVAIPADSIVEPVRRAPVQPADRISSIQLTDPEAWEELRGIAEQASVSGDVRARGALRATEFDGDEAVGGSTFDRARPSSRTTGSTSSSVGAPMQRNRPTSDAGSQPAATPSARERPTPSDGGSSARPFEPAQTE